MFAYGKNISNDSFPQNVDQKTCPKFPLATWLCLPNEFEDSEAVYILLRKLTAGT